MGAMVHEGIHCVLASLPGAEDGTPVYSTPVTSGTCSLELVKQPVNNVIITVVSNTDYIYHGEETRNAHYDYRIQLGNGIVEAADINTRWYDDWDLPVSDEVGVSTGKRVDDGFSISVKQDASQRFSY
ncbi:MAG: hypothetical protein ACOCSE_01625 [Chitinivibrionales bacterium]